MRSRENRLSRGSFLRGVAVLAAGSAAAALAAACGAPTPTATPAPASKPAAPAAAPPAAPTATTAAQVAPTAPAATAAPKAAAPAPTQPPAAAAAPKAAGQREVVWWAASGSPLRDQAYAKSIEIFQKKNPNVVVKYVLQPDLEAVLNSALASGTGPDFSPGVYNPGNTQVKADANLILKLDDHYKANNWPVMPWARKRMMYKGGTWGIPDEAEYIAVWYNNAVLKKAVVGVPGTFDDMLVASKTIKDKLNITPFGIANNGGGNGGHFLSALLEARIGRDEVEKILFQDGRWDQPAVAEATQKYVDLFQAGYASKDGNALNSDRVTVSFAQGKHAFWLTGTWNIKRFEDVKKKDVPDLEYDYFVLPALNPSLKPRPVGGQGEGYAVSAKPRDLDATVAWVSHFLGPENARIKIEELAEVPCLTTLQPAEYKVPPITKKLLETVLGPEGLGYSIDGVVSQRVRESFVQSSQGLAAGDLTAKDFATQMQKLWEMDRAEGKLWRP